MGRFTRKVQKSQSRKGDFDLDKVVDGLIADGWPIIKWYENGQLYYKLLDKRR